MLTSVANSSSLSSMLATVTSPWLTNGKSKGLVEIRSKSMKHKDSFSILCTACSAVCLFVFFSNATNSEDENNVLRTYQLVQASCLT